MARITFIAGPAIEMRMSSRFRLVRLAGLTGTGLAQPNNTKPGFNESIINGRNTVPIGSMWTIGLIVMRPIIRAVSSPHLCAIQAWAYSWNESSTTRHIQIATMLAS